MSRAKSREEEILKGVRFRNRIIIFLSIALLVSIGGLVRAPHIIDVYQPPDLRYGSMHSQTEVPHTAVYSFASHIFTVLNTWSTNGSVDYKENASRLNAYLSPTYFGEIYKDADSRESNNELSGRTRVVSPADGTSFSNDTVKVIGPDAWVVYLDIHLEERVKNNVVKDTHVRYPIRVIRRSISRESNPWQLALDGYESIPRRLLVDNKTAKK